MREDLTGVLFLGGDWAEAHDDIERQGGTAGSSPGAGWLKGWPGSLICTAWSVTISVNDDNPDQVLVGIETDRRPWVQALLAAGYQVRAINPIQAARYRGPHSSSRAKSDPGDAHVLAEIVRLDRAHHRPVAGDSALAEHVKVAARAHQTMIWMGQRNTSTMWGRAFTPG